MPSVAPITPGPTARNALAISQSTRPNWRPPWTVVCVSYWAKSAPCTITLHPPTDAWNIGTRDESGSHDVPDPGRACATPSGSETPGAIPMCIVSCCASNGAARNPSAAGNSTASASIRVDINRSAAQ